jgi:hypothetical protein
MKFSFFCRNLLAVATMNPRASAPKAKLDGDPDRAQGARRVSPACQEAKASSSSVSIAACAR